MRSRERAPVARHLRKFRTCRPPGTCREDGGTVCWQTRHCPQSRRGRG